MGSRRGSNTTAAPTGTPAAAVAPPSSVGVPVPPNNMNPPPPSPSKAGYQRRGAISINTPHGTQPPSSSQQPQPNLASHIQI
jgi:hypothetical protein